MTSKSLTSEDRYKILNCLKTMMYASKCEKKRTFFCLQDFVMVPDEMNSDNSDVIDGKDVKMSIEEG